MISKFFAAFVPIFVAIDFIGILPIFIAMTNGVFVEKRLRIVNQAALTAFMISFAFIYLGQGIFKFLGITIPDFKIAGGLLLLVFAVNDLLFSDRTRRKEGGDADETIGVVPIGMPLIIGPAVLTTLLLSVGAHGYTATVLALMANIGIVWGAFRYSEKIIRWTSISGAIAVGKVFSLLLAAIAVMMMRSGFTEILQAPH
jgi:multiple antibiotic resistance protein